MKSIFIVGAGSFGTALAQAWSKKLEVRIYGNEKSVVDEINVKRTNEKYLPGVKLHKDIIATNSLSEVTHDDLIIIAVPSYAVKKVCQELKPYIKKQRIVSTTKGIDEAGRVMTDVIEKTLGLKKGRVYAISGPSIAKEVATGHHTVLVIGGTKNKAGRKIEKLLRTEKMHTTLSSDKDGIQLLGFYKNVIAILVGVCEELGVGNNFKTALISRAYSQFYESNKNKIEKQTFVGPAGIGDLFVTAGSTQSRNHKFGRMLVKYHSIKEIKEKIGHIVEGYESMRKLKENVCTSFDCELIHLMKKINRTKEKEKMEKLLLKYLNQE